MVTISVVLPCYNAGEYLPRAIKSIQDQTYKNIEIIVVDDGSTESATIEYLDSLESEIILVRQKNKGLPAARNAGIKQATGEYILPLDCDDFIAPTFIEVGLKILHDSSDDVFVYANMKTFGDDRGVLKRHYNYFEQLFLNRLPYCMIYSKAAWTKIGGYDESMRDGLEDWEYNLNLGGHGIYGCEINEPLFNYYISQSGMLSSHTHNKRGQIWSYIQNKHSDLYKFSAIWTIYKKWNKKYSAYPATFHLFIYFAHKVLPKNVFNSFYGKLLSLSKS